MRVSARKSAIAILLVMILAASVAALAGCGQTTQTKATVPGGGTKVVTPTNQLHVETAEGQPSINVTTYRLKIGGLVDHPVSLTFEQINAIPAVERFVNLPCVEGWTDSAVWKGPRLADVLKQAGVKSGATTVVFKSPGGYSTSLALADVATTDPMLAYGVNGTKLPDEQGYPLRLVVPHRLGYKWIKWVVDIQLIKGSYEGYWESRGYSNDANANGR